MLAILGLSFILLQEPGSDTAEFKDIRAAIEALHADGPEVRARAAAFLIRFGANAVPALGEALQSNADPNARHSIEEILSAIRAREHLSTIRPRPTRCVLQFSHETPESILSSLSQDFALKPFVVEPLPKVEGCSMDLTDATLWQALDAFRQATGCDIDEGLSFRPLRIAPKGKGGLMRKSFSAGDFRILAWHAESGPARDGIPRILLAVDVLAPPGLWIEAYDIGSPVVQDGEVHRLRSSPEVAFRVGVRSERESGIPSRASGRCFAVPSADLEGVRSITLKGEISISLPEAIEERLIDLSKDWHELAWGGTQIVLKWNGDVRSFGCKVSGKAGPTPVRFQVSALDEKDLWIRDLGQYRATGEDDFEFPDERVFLPKKPAKIILWKVSKVETVTIPFIIRDIPLVR